jgi:hypothetical protein
MLVGYPAQGVVALYALWAVKLCKPLAVAVAEVVVIHGLRLL